MAVMSAEQTIALWAVIASPCAAIIVGVVAFRTGSLDRQSRRELARDERRHVVLQDAYRDLEEWLDPARQAVRRLADPQAGRRQKGRVQARALAGASPPVRVRVNAAADVQAQVAELRRLLGAAADSVDHLGEISDADALARALAAADRLLLAIPQSVRNDLTALVRAPQGRR